MNPLALIGRFTVALLGEIGSIFLFASKAIPACITPPVYGRLILQPMLRIMFVN